MGLGCQVITWFLITCGFCAHCATPQSRTAEARRSAGSGRAARPTGWLVADCRCDLVYTGGDRSRTETSKYKVCAVAGYDMESACRNVIAEMYRPYCRLVNFGRVAVCPLNAERIGEDRTKD
jgi:hypothetical protein